METNWKSMEEGYLRRFSRLEKRIKEFEIKEEFEKAYSTLYFKFKAEENYIGRALKFKNFSKYMEKVHILLNRKI